MPAGSVAGVFLITDLAFFGANVIKIEHGGWFPLLLAGAVYGVMTTWHTGRQVVTRRLAETEVPLTVLFDSVKAKIHKLGVLLCTPICTSRPRWSVT